jgi:poly-beta-1,6-N-acetyl-D-glucosamine synthase
VFQYVIVVISFVSLYLILVWLNIFFLSAPQRNELKHTPRVVLAIPARDEAESIVECLESVASSGYPLEKLEVFVAVNNTTDNTAQLARQYVCKNGLNWEVLELVGKGKAYALNEVLKRASGNFFAVIDADSRITPGSIHRILGNFTSEKVGCVISSIKAINTNNVIEKIQRVEYLTSMFVRNIMSSIDTLYVTPGVLSVYRADVLRKIGGFDAGNLTEDLEIALRLRSFGYSIRADLSCITYTKVPNTLKELFRQRIRWMHGFFMNFIRYRKMAFNPSYSFLGLFQIPVLFISIPMLLASVSLVFYNFITGIYNFAFRAIMLDGYLVSLIQHPPTLTQFFFGINLKIALVISIASVVGIVFLVIVHRVTKEKVWPSVALYLLVLPYLSAAQFVLGFASYMRRAARK